jgi:hypothetical protein
MQQPPLIGISFCLIIIRVSYGYSTGEERQAPSTGSSAAYSRNGRTTIGGRQIGTHSKAMELTPVTINVSRYVQRDEDPHLDTLDDAKHSGALGEGDLKDMP